MRPAALGAPYSVTTGGVPQARINVKPNSVNFNNEKIVTASLFSHLAGLTRGRPDSILVSGLNWQLLRDLFCKLVLSRQSLFLI